MYIGLVKIMLTLMDYFSPADRRTPYHVCFVNKWFLQFKC